MSAKIRTLHARLLFRGGALGGARLAPGAARHLEALARRAACVHPARVARQWRLDFCAAGDEFPRLDFLFASKLLAGACGKALQVRDKLGLSAVAGPDIAAV